MSEEKKPKATFGDVMLGIPAGRGGEGSEEPKPEQGEKKPGGKGPMVVVRRSGGVVETRSLEVKTIEPAAPATPAADGAVAAPKPKVEPLVPSVAQEMPESETFGEMFEAQLKSGDVPGRKGMPKVGEKVKGKIFQLGAETAFVTIGKHEAMIELDELKDEEGVLRFGIGDEVEAHVIETGAKGIVLSRKLPKGAASMQRLSDAKAMGLPVEGLVIGVNKGGLEIAVGEVRAFCPQSQVDIRPSGKLDHFIGEKLVFRVTEVKERNVVLSRRAVLEEEQKAKAAETRKSLVVGAVLKGKVVSVQAFGAFVDLGGIEGMVPVSELSHLRVGHPNEVVDTGDDVEVEVLRIEAAEPNSPDKSKRKERITLSMRSRQEDPFKAALAELQEGTRTKGKVVRLQPFGAFIELKPGVDGLMHISAMAERRIAHPRDVLKVGEEVEVVVEKLDPNEKKIGLRLIKDGAPVGEGVASSGSAPAEGGAAERPERKEAPKARRGQIVTGKVERIEQFGIFIGWEGGKGLIPASETGTERGTDLKRVFPMGKEVKAEIIEMEGSKLKLSITKALRSEERADLDAYVKSQPKQQGKTGFGTLADKFKNLKLS